MIRSFKSNNAADAEPEDVKFGVYYKNGEENKWSTINNLVGKPSMNYGLERTNIQ